MTNPTVPTPELETVSELAMLKYKLLSQQYYYSYIIALQKCAMLEKQVLELQQLLENKKFLLH